MRIYISGPITGTDDHFRRFIEAEASLEEKGLQVINPERLAGVMPKEATHDDFMKICYSLLDLADAIYMLDGWKDSKGATMEMQYAIEHKIAIVFQGGRLS